ncbi:hypothetical protein BV22DRAFT_122308 [Leucogyrophana mollusca]|uniref:Uncharacterized protein n=1 Tax=Leucogyrophana mollusca TaxID=85980 RepID=A0ACB8BXH8_9AGAM|nr:hypothetical protein BV22DRAFT_122308 [Leucogyrophana mollusca]
MPDPVADKNGFLRLYMKNHPDTLVAYVKHFGKVKENVATAELKDIDSKGMTLAYKLQSGQDRFVRVEFNPPLAGYEEVKPRMLAMKAEAQESLGMIKAPQLTKLFVPLSIIPSTLFLLTFLYVTLPPPDTHPFFGPSRWLNDAVGTTGMFSKRGVFGLVATVHSLEALYTYSLCRRYVKGALLSMAYVLLTLPFGYPIWAEIRRRVQVARIDSVMKVE